MKDNYHPPIITLRYLFIDYAFLSTVDRFTQMYFMMHIIVIIISVINSLYLFHKTNLFVLMQPYVNPH